MSKLNAYEILEDRQIGDISSRGMILRHKKTGARVVVLSNDDDNKVFYIGFRTTPEDETGVPHIIEHTTLCGSEKYPVKDPFIELAKGSLNTFLNAMTYPDMTLYPLASYNLHDFCNLMDVYLDAVFHPNITRYEEIFKQEGWHYEIEEEDAPITINGVVYNEMKGAYSSPDEVLQSAVYRSLFPDNTYSKDYGGNPVHIPELTYQAYLDFYHKYYHPSNSYIYLYGDMDVEERLDYIDREYLSKYDYLEVDSAILPQKSFEKPVERTVTYAIAMDDPEENASYLSYNKVVANCLDPMLYLAFEAIDYALCSTPGAPVRQALLDAGIGEDIYGQYDRGILQPVFSIVTKNANAEDKEQFEEIITSVLRQQAKDGIDASSLMAALNSAEFRFREADYGQFPKGLLYGLQVLDSWVYDDMVPFMHLECLETFRKLRENIGTGYFENLITTYLLDNPHGSLVMVLPERGKNDREEEEQVRQMEELKASMTPEEISCMISQTHALHTYQETPSSEEELASIPQLTRSDLKKEAAVFHNREEHLELDHADPVKVVCHDIDTNGIAYFDLLFDIEDIPASDLGYLAFLSTIHGLISTQGYDYHALSNQVDIYTGGITEGPRFFEDCENRDHFMMKYQVSVKVLNDNIETACHLVKEILLSSDYRNIKRLKELLAQTKARMQYRLSSNGHITAATRGAVGFSRNAWYKDRLKGIEYYRFLCQAEKLLEENPEAFCSKLESMNQMIFVRKRLMFSFSGDHDLYLQAAPYLLGLAQKMEDGCKCGETPKVELSATNEAFTDSSQIQYVAKCANFADKGFEFTGTLRLLRQILSLDFLWNTVRVKGGAYGVMTDFDRNGDSYFVSYRDPNLQKTLQAYDGIPDYLRSFDPDERDMTKYIIGTFGMMDTPMNPEAKGQRSMRAYLEGISYDRIQNERLQILKAQAEDIRGLADLVEAVISDANICVIGNEGKIKKNLDLFAHTEKLLS